MNFRMLLIFLALAPQMAWAFPEMIRHGYTSCTTCHISPQGGGLLNEYGKELAKELLTRNDSLFRDSPQEKKFLEIATPAWWQLGGQARLLQIFSESSQASKGRFIIMQVQAESAVKLHENVDFYSSVARFETTKQDPEWKDFIYIPELWLRYQKLVATTNFSLRAGRFFPMYGLWLAEHTMVNRKFLGFNPGEERAAIEASVQTQNYQINLTSIQGRSFYGSLKKEAGTALQISKIYNSKLKVGLDIYRSRTDKNEISFEGLYAMIGWSEDLSILFQIDQIHNPENKTGVSELLKFSWGLSQGFELSATQEYYNSDTEKSDPRFEAYGLGFQYFPFPHLVLSGNFRLQKDSNQMAEFQKVVWLLGHIYF